MQIEMLDWQTSEELLSPPRDWQFLIKIVQYSSKVTIQFKFNMLLQNRKPTE